MSQTESNKDIKRIAAKIAKCLALANSDNPAEAEAAKRQAEALMKKHGLTNIDVAASAVTEQTASTGAKYRPAAWVSTLAQVIAGAFACEPILEISNWRNTTVRFIGAATKPELAAYTFEVLHRQLKKHRREYLTTQKRCKRTTKIRRANIFCQQWVYRVADQVQEFAGTKAEKTAIDAYKKKQFSKLGTYDKKPTTAIDRGDYDAAYAGNNAAGDIYLNRPVQTKKKAYLENGNG